MLTREAILHIPKSNYSYAYDDKKLHMRIRTKKDEAEKVYLRIGDPYEWAYGSGGGNLNGDGAKGWIGGKTYPMKKELSTKYFDYWFCEYIPSKKRSRYAFIIEDFQEKILFGEKKIEILDGRNDEEKLCSLANFFSFPYLNKKDVLNTPEWAKNTVWYQIFPERFCNGNPEISPENVKSWGSKPNHKDFMGGDLFGLYEKIGYLKELGITGIYLCPIFSGKTSHKYDTIDYYEIDRNFGDKEIFKKIVEKCHRYGIKIMLDAVFNHVGTEFKYWKDVVENGENSKYVDWFVINRFPVYKKYDDNKLNYESFAFSPHMPKLNLENPECREYFLKVAEYWIKEFNIDGWRLDVCNEIDHGFWREFRDRVKKIKKDAYILGEVWHNALPWLMGDQFDAVMNYPLSDAIIDFLTSETPNIKDLKNSINETMVAYPKNVTEVNFNLLDSHDTTRILTTLKNNEEKLKTALMLLFFQAGSPCIYYGTEVGMTGSIIEDQNRKCMIWEEEKQNKQIFDFSKKLIKIRKENEDFQNLEIQWLEQQGSKNIILKKGKIILIVNSSHKEKSFVKLKEVISSKKIFDMFLERFISEETIELKPSSFILLKI